ncbi:MAG: hypothetical protein AB7H92_14015 [Microbacteriaceae bacterium]
MAITYATREQVASAFDSMSAFLDATIDRLVEQASRNADRACNRRFYPLTATRTFPWPSRGAVWLPDDLLTATTVALDGTTVTGHVLEDAFLGAPYDRIDFSDASRHAGEEVTITGTWGYSNDTRPAGALAAAMSDTTGTTAVVTNSALVGVGDLLLVDSERLEVTGKTASTTGTTTSEAVHDETWSVAIPVASGAAVNVGETILVDSERMRVVGITGNTLTVIRAVDGSVLAYHGTGSTVSAYRTLTVVRAAAGTTAATHNQGAAVVRNFPPPLITELVIADAASTLGREQAGWSDTTGSGESQRATPGVSFGDLLYRALKLYRRNRIGEAV